MTEDRLNLHRAVGVTMFTMGAAMMFTGFHFLWGVVGVVAEVALVFFGAFRYLRATRSSAS